VAIWLFYGDLVYFSRFGMLYQQKSGNSVIAESKKRVLVKTDKIKGCQV
jgi:hypothetical protein